MVMPTKQILSPLPGILYRRPAPDKPLYVVALIEVMKSFHNVASGLKGKIVKFLVENEDTVMAGQPIAEIDDGE